MKLKFKEALKKSSIEKNSKIILALDIPAEEPKKLFSKAIKIIRETQKHICAVKFNRHLIIPLDLKTINKLIEETAAFNLPTIMDCKIGDIGNTNKIIAEYYFKAGFNALTANPIVGWSNALDIVFETAKKFDGGILLLAYMSHSGAKEHFEALILNRETGTIKPQYLIFAEKAINWGADGVIVGATKPDKIKEIKALVEDVLPIISPGVGVQGGRIEEALAAGADYIIVGRSIVLAKKPSEAAEKLKHTITNALKSL